MRLGRLLTGVGLLVTITALALAGTVIGGGIYFFYFAPAGQNSSVASSVGGAAAPKPDITESGPIVPGGSGCSIAAGRDVTSNVINCNFRPTPDELKAVAEWAARQGLNGIDVNRALDILRSPVEADLAAVDAAVAALKSGQVAFNTPDKARVGKQSIVEVILSTRLPAEGVRALIDQPGKRESAPLKIGAQMQATLSGGSGFDISPSGPVTQFVSDAEPTSWHWQVTPKVSGSQNLVLSLDALINVGGKTGIRNINTFTRTINVDVDWPETPEEWLAYIKKIGEDLSWFWATLFLPIGAAIWAWIKRKPKRSVADTDLS